MRDVIDEVWLFFCFYIWVNLILDQVKKYYMYSNLKLFGKGWVDGVWLFFCFYTRASLIRVKKILHVFSVENLDWMWVFWDEVWLFYFYKRVNMILGQVKHITYWNYLERSGTKKFILSNVELPRELLFLGGGYMGDVGNWVLPFLLFFLLRVFGVRTPFGEPTIPKSPSGFPILGVTNSQGFELMT